MQRRHIIVEMSDIQEYRMWSILGDQPANYVCEAPDSEEERIAMEEALAEGEHKLIHAWVQSQTKGQ